MTTVSASAGRRQAIWREHCDAVNRAWLGDRLPSLRMNRLLKTDAFDEAVAAGLYPLLSERARDVIGIDLSRSTLLAAAGRYASLHLAQADVRSLPFASGTIDGIVSTSTLDHFSTLADIDIALGELHRILRNGGSLWLTLDNLGNPAVAVRNALPFRLLNRAGIVPYQIGATCTPRGLDKLLRQAGFEVLELEAILHCPRVLAVAAAQVVERYGSSFARRRFLEFLMAFERMAHWPSRFGSGYFIAVVARKPSFVDDRAAQG